MSFELLTARLRLRELRSADAPFVLALLNDPDWLRFIGDRGVHDIAAATRYIEDGPAAAYREDGFGLWLVERREDGLAAGLCGLLRRDWLDAVDLGFAFLPDSRRRGFAAEAGHAVLAHARDVLGLPRIVAITRPENLASRRTLEKLGLRYERLVHAPGADDPLAYYA